MLVRSFEKLPEVIRCDVKDLKTLSYYLGVYFPQHGYDARYLLVRAEDKWRIVRPSMADDFHTNCIYNEATLLGVVERAMRNCKIEIHAFETRAALYKWASGNDD